MVGSYCSLGRTQMGYAGTLTESLLHTKKGKFEETGYVI